MASIDDKARFGMAIKLSLSEKRLYDKLKTSGGQALEDILPAIESLAWRAVLAKIYGDGDPDRELDDIDRAVRGLFFDWAEQNRLDDLSDLSIVEDAGAPLAGEPSEAALKAKRLVRETNYEPRRLAALIYYVLAPTLRRWEEEKIATPEEMADFLLPTLGADPASPPRSTAALAAFGAHLWRLLQSQADKDIDYWKTVRAFGDFFVRAKGRTPQAIAATAYRTLIEVLAPQAQATNAADLVRGAANNLVSIFDELAGRSPDGAVAEAAAAAARLHFLVGDAIEERHRWPSWRRRLALLDDLGNTPLAFQQAGTDALELRYLRQAWFSARAACARARLREPGKANAKDVAAAFFNAGVALLRYGGRRLPAVARARVALNLLGAHCSLLFAQGDAEIALGPYNGGDCAVNLFGALTDLDETQIAALRPQIGGLYARLAESRNAISKADWQKIENSSKRLELGDPDNPADSLPQAMAAFMAKAGESLDLPPLIKLAGMTGDASDEGQRRRIAASTWLVAARSMQPLAKGRFLAICRPVWRLLNRQPPTLDELPDAIAADWLAFLAGKHPLEAGGLMKHEEIETILAEGKDSPESLGQWLGKNAGELAKTLGK